jgi:hypothetical protein
MRCSASAVEARLERECEPSGKRHARCGPTHLSFGPNDDHFNTFKFFQTSFYISEIKKFDIGKRR